MTISRAFLPSDLIMSPLPQRNTKKSQLSKANFRTNCISVIPTPRAASERKARLGEHSPGHKSRAAIIMWALCDPVFFYLACGELPHWFKHAFPPLHEFLHLFFTSVLHFQPTILELDSCLWTVVLEHHQLCTRSIFFFPCSGSLLL